MAQIRVSGFLHFFVQFILPGHYQRVCAIPFPHTVQRQQTSASGTEPFRSTNTLFFGIIHRTHSASSSCRQVCCLTFASAGVWGSSIYQTELSPALFWLVLGTLVLPLPKTAPPFAAARKQGQNFPVFDAFWHIQACKWVMKYVTCRNL